MISFSIVFFLPLTFYLLLSQSAVSNSSIYIFNSVLTLSRSLLMQSPSQLWCSSPPFPLLFPGFCSLPVYLLPCFHLISPCTHHQLLLRISFNLASTLISSILVLSAFLTPTIFLPGCLPQARIFFRCFSDSAIVSSAFVYTGVTHGLSTFPACV